VLVADLTLEDAFGRAVHSSAVEFTSATGFDPVTGLSVQPTSVLLAQGFGERAQLKVLAHFAIAGDVDVSGPGHGVSYLIADGLGAGVTADGQVIARSNGQTQLTVTYGQSSVTVPVVVDATATVTGAQLLPVSPTIPRVGKTVQLTFDATLSTGLHV